MDSKKTEGSTFWENKTKTNRKTRSLGQRIFLNNWKVFKNLHVGSAIVKLFDKFQRSKMKREVRRKVIQRNRRHLSKRQPRRKRGSQWTKQMNNQKVGDWRGWRVVQNITPSKARVEKTYASFFTADTRDPQGQGRSPHRSIWWISWKLD